MTECNDVNQNQRDTHVRIQTDLFFPPKIRVLVFCFAERSIVRCVTHFTRVTCGRKFGR